MSHIGEHTSIRSDNAGAVIDLLVDALARERATREQYERRLQELTEENERLEKTLEPCDQKAPAHKFKAGQRIKHVNGNCGTVTEALPDIDSFDYLVVFDKAKDGAISAVLEADISPAPSEAPDAALPTV